MSNWMAHLRFWAQGSGEEWVNILFIVAVAVFWVIGGLIKAAGGRKNAPQSRRQPTREQKQDTWQQRLARKAEEIKQAAEDRIRTLQEQVESEPPAQESPAQGRVTVRARRGGESVLVYERHDSRAMAEQKQRQALRADQAQQAAAARRRRMHLEPKAAPIAPPPSPFPEALAGMGHSPRSLGSDALRPKASPSDDDAPISPFDYADPDELKRAILHYEILGKPLSLRDPFEQTSGF